MASLSVKIKRCVCGQLKIKKYELEHHTLLAKLENTMKSFEFKGHKAPIVDCTQFNQVGPAIGEKLM